MPKEDSKKTKYSSEEIVVLEGLEPVRKRPGMYIGSTGPDGLHHLLVEIYENSRDEAMGGFASEVEVALLPDGMVRVADNGRGIPVDIHAKTKVSALETVMTTLHAGGKFEGTAYKISGGLHGVGASVVNALSEWVRVDVYKDGNRYWQEYKIGKKLYDVKKGAGDKKLNGTITTFKPDTSIFLETEYDWERVVNYLRQQAYLVKKFKIRLLDLRQIDPKTDFQNVYYLEELGLEAPATSFYFEGGLLSLVNFYNLEESPVHNHIFYIEKSHEETGVQVEIAFQYIDDIQFREVSYANNTSTIEGGMHLTGFRTALTRTINDYAKKNNLIKDADGAFSGEDVREGLTAVVSVKLREPQFEGQTKAKLGNVEARSATEIIFGEALSAFLEENPDDGRAIINKVTLALRARKAAKAAKDSILRKGAMEGMALPGKLADCQSKSAEESEIFIVEGDSAGGSAKQGRDRRTQAILPLFGKVLNTERARLDKILKSDKIKTLIIALGTGIGEEFDVSRLRYHKIIIMADADVDGSHIKTLYLTLFFRHLKPLVEGGFIYVALPPLFKIKKGKEIKYAYNDAEKAEIIRGMGGNPDEFVEMPVDDSEEQAEASTVAVKQAKIVVQRFKGLGEMDAEELWETTMDPARRVLKRITVESAMEADRIFETLMGAEVPPRKLFIQTHAKLANIDV